MAALKAESALNPIQRFLCGTIDAPAEMAGWGGTFMVVRKDEVLRALAVRGEEPYIVLREKRGQATA